METGFPHSLLRGFHLNQLDWKWKAESASENDLQSNHFD